VSNSGDKYLEIPEYFFDSSKKIDNNILIEYLKNKNAR
jgi:hypothetical protein